MQKIKNLVVFLVFIIYTILIFFISNQIIILFIFIFNLILFLVFKLSFKNLLYNLKWASFVIIFTSLINIFFDSLYSSLLLGIRLFICYFTTYIYSKKIKISDLSEAIELLFYPFRIFKINTSNIGIIISIAICMIPVLRQEIFFAKNTLISRGQKLNISFMTIILKPLLISVLKRTNEMEKTLISKGYK